MYKVIIETVYPMATTQNINLIEKMLKIGFFEYFTALNKYCIQNIQFCKFNKLKIQVCAPKVFTLEGSGQVYPF